MRLLFQQLNNYNQKFLFYICIYIYILHKVYLKEITVQSISAKRNSSFKSRGLSDSHE